MGFETWFVGDACGSANRTQHERRLKAFVFAFGEVLSLREVLQRLRGGWRRATVIGRRGNVIKAPLRKWPNESIEMPTSKSWWMMIKLQLSEVRIRGTRELALRWRSKLPYRQQARERA